ncbi:MAG: FmdB family zinc ribbon protein [Chloroflexota bacterium]
MPIYEFQCTSCGCRFDKRQSFDAEPVATCPECNNEARRVFQPTPIIFKGSGFYVTDYSKGSSNPALANSRKNGEHEESGAKESSGSGATAESES